MKAHEMRTLAEDELTGRITTWQEEYFRARCDKAVGQLQNPNQLGELRREIARGKTILKEKQKHAGSQD